VDVAQFMSRTVLHNQPDISMAKTSFVDFKAVKAAITMEQVLEHYGILDKFKRGTDSLNGPCPIHGGSNATQFRVSISKNIWNCFSECKHGGNVLDFLAKMEDCSIHAAALKAIEWFNLDAEAMSADSSQEAGETGDASKAEEAPRPRTVAKPVPVTENSIPNTPLKFRLDKLEREHPYLTQERGLTRETIVDFGVGFCSKGMMADRIAIPIHNVKGEVVAYAGRFPGEPAEDTPKYKLPPGFKKSLELFNLDRAGKEPGPLVVVEGFFGCMKLHQFGCRKVVALMGSTMSAAQEALIKQLTDRTNQVIVILDEDESGRAGREDIAVRLAKFLFVKIHVFDQEGRQADTMSAEEVGQLLP
jgi:DNA primase